MYPTRRSSFVALSVIDTNSLIKIFFTGALLIASSFQSVTAQVTATQTYRMIPNDSAPNDRFGSVVTLSGSTALIGAFSDTVDGNTRQGSAYVFDVTTGQQIRKLTVSDGEAYDCFGSAVALSGNTALIGASANYIIGTSPGAAYIFDTSTGTQIRKLSASDGTNNDYFGGTVALSGNFALIGATGDDIGSNLDQGSVYVFDINTGNQLRKITVSGSESFGRVSLSGTTALIGASGEDFGRGSAYLYDITTGNQIRKFTANDGEANDGFGRTVDIEGNFAVVGTSDSNDGSSAYVFDVSTGNQLFKLTVPSSFSFASSISISGNYVLFGAPLESVSETSQGAAYIFNLLTGVQVAKLIANDFDSFEDFGTAVYLSGETALIGNDPITSSESVYVFAVSGTTVPEWGTLPFFVIAFLSSGSIILLRTIRNSRSAPHHSCP